MVVGFVGLRRMGFIIGDEGAPVADVERVVIVVVVFVCLLSGREGGMERISLLRIAVAVAVACRCRDRCLAARLAARGQSRDGESGR